MIQKDSNYVVHVQQTEDSPVLAYVLLVVVVTWILAVIYAIAF